MSSDETFEIIVKKGTSFFRNVKIEDGKIMVNNRLVGKLPKNTPVNITVDGNIKGEFVLETSTSKVEQFVKHKESETIKEHSVSSELG